MTATCYHCNICPSTESTFCYFEHNQYQKTGLRLTCLWVLLVLKSILNQDEFKDYQYFKK